MSDAMMLAYSKKSVVAGFVEQQSRERDRTHGRDPVKEALAQAAAARPYRGLRSVGPSKDALAARSGYLR